MTIAEALDYIVGLTGHDRFRQLCDLAHPDFHPDAPALMIRLASEGWTPPPPSPPTPEEIAARRASKPRIPLGQPQQKGPRP